MTNPSRQTPEADNVRRRIGELNGPWALLLKMSLAAFPVIMSILIPWLIWVTSEVFANKGFRESGERFSKQDALTMEARIMEHIATVKVNSLQIQYAREDIEELKMLLKELKIEVQKGH